MSTHSFGSLQHFATFCTAMATAGRVEHHHALDAAAKHLEGRAKAVIGTYDLKWPPLAASTQAERVRLGYPADEPLLRTGELRDSVQHSVDGNTARVGTSLDKAVWHEMGTSRAPPRSFLRLSAIEQEAELVRILRGGLLHGVVTP